MPKKDEITVGCKVNIEIARKLKEIANDKGMSVNAYLKAVVGDMVDPVEENGLLEVSFLYNIDPQDFVCYIKDMIENGLLEVSFLYNIDPQDLVCDIKDMLDNGELIIEDGKLKKRYVT